MKISELIGQLSSVIQLHGDLDVLMNGAEPNVLIAIHPNIHCCLSETKPIKIEIINDNN